MTSWPLSDTQRALWAARHPGLSPGGGIACRYVAIDVPNLDLDRYQAAWRQVIARHPVLHAVVGRDGCWHPDPNRDGLAFTVDDLTNGDDRTLHTTRKLLLDLAADTSGPPVRIHATIVGTVTRVHIAVDAIVADEDAMAILGADVAAAYASGVPLPPLRQRFAHNVPRRLDPPGPLPDLPPAPQLPTSGTAHATGLLTTRTWRLPAPMWTAFQQTCRAHHVDVTTALLAAYAHTLSRWAKDPAFTLAHTGTTRPVTATDVVDNFTFARPVSIDADPTRSVRDTIASYRWQPPAVLRHLAMQAAEPSQSPTGVRFTTRLEPASPTGSWALDGHLVDEAVLLPQVLLHHHAILDSDDLVLRFDSADATFPTGMIDDLIWYHQAVLTRLADSSDAWTAPAAEGLPEDLPPHQEAVRARVNATAGPLPDGLLHEPFWAQATRTPDAVAVIAERTLTYHQVRAGATAVAAQLRHLGVPAGQMVAVVAPKGWEQVVAVLGILHAGAAYVPVAADSPTERLHHLLRHAEATVAVTTRPLAKTLSWPDTTHLIVVDDTVLDGPADHQPGRHRDPDDLAYTIYTSGSTGVPKGVMISHRAALNTITDINHRFTVGPDDRVFALSALGFDLSVYDIFGLLAVGGAVVVPAPDTLRAPWYWTELLDQHHVTIWNTVPALMEMLVEYCTGRRQPLPPTLRLVLMSGDWIPVSLPDRIRQLSTPDIDLIGMGGATEASIWSNYHRIGAVDPTWPSIPYGTPLTNQTFDILDRGLRRRPDLVPGELHIGGAGVALGYWHDPDRTAASFITHPRTGQRLYRTGDLGRYHPDGVMEFLGREDFQVKIHGFRVELGEIEAALLSHDDITAAVVTAINAPGGGKRLVAYVAPDSTSDTEVLRAYLAAKLPSYLVPDHILTLDTLPLTNNGKVDRQALPAPESQAAPASHDEESAAVDATEAAILEAWQQILGLPTLTATSDVIALGADDLDLLHLTEHVTADVSTATIRNLPTPRALAHYVHTTRGTVL